MVNNYRHFENEETLMKELLQHLNAQYEYVDGNQDEAVYYDWIYWVLGKLDEVKDTANGIVNS